jgi:hypothetical protein
MLVCFACLAVAGESFVPPRSGSPSFYLIRSINKKKGEIDLVAMSVVLAEPLDVKALKIKPGLPKTKLVPREMTWYVGVNVAHTAAGKRIESSKIWDMVKVGQVVVLALDEQGLDPRYKERFKPDTIIISLPK